MVCCSDSLLCEKGPLAAFSFGLSSVCLSLVNKQILSVYHFESQRLLIALHMCFSLCVLYLMRCIGYADFPNLSWGILKNVGGLGVLNGANVMLSMASLGLVNLPMYTSLRRLSVLFVIGVDWLLRGELPNRPTLLSILLMIVGSVLGGLGDLEFDGFGYALVGLNNLSTAVYLVFLNRADKAHADASSSAASSSGSSGGGASEQTKLNGEGTTFYVSLVSTILLFIYASLNDEFRSARDSPLMADPIFVWTIVLSTVCAFVLHYSTTLCTQYNSALTTSVTGQIKNALATVIGMIWFNVPPTPMLLVGLSIGLIGSGWYSSIKLNEQLARKALKASQNGSANGYAPVSTSEIDPLSPAAIPPTAAGGEVDISIELQPTTTITTLASSAEDGVASAANGDEASRDGTATPPLPPPPLHKPISPRAQST